MHRVTEGVHPSISPTRRHHVDVIGRGQVLQGILVSNGKKHCHCNRYRADTSHRSEIRKSGKDFPYIHLRSHKVAITFENISTLNH